ncbi:hypothetical protein Dda_8659 [Drechslerella dactyloides]|uniref:Uncharacterized protein n=1 Tax=Drechslerella dactyloides TaxID=74499 RepID=A0AAD6IQZ9_DREDA|nr:hypothetical protein Dda_8659 [Drechslerella dactyloides]
MESLLQSITTLHLLFDSNENEIARYPQPRTLTLPPTTVSYFIPAASIALTAVEPTSYNTPDACIVESGLFATASARDLYLIPSFTADIIALPRINVSVPNILFSTHTSLGLPGLSGPANYSSTSNFDSDLAESAMTLASSSILPSNVVTETASETETTTALHLWRPHIPATASPLPIAIGVPVANAEYRAESSLCILLLTVLLIGLYIIRIQYPSRTTKSVSVFVAIFYALQTFFSFGFILRALSNAFQALYAISGMLSSSDAARWSLPSTDAVDRVVELYGQESVNLGAIYVVEAIIVTVVMILEANILWRRGDRILRGLIMAACGISAVMVLVAAWAWRAIIWVAVVFAFWVQSPVNEVFALHYHDHTTDFTVFPDITGLLIISTFNRPSLKFRVFTYHKPNKRSFSRLEHAQMSTYWRRPPGPRGSNHHRLPRVPEGPRVRVNGPGFARIPNEILDLVIRNLSMDAAIGCWLDDETNRRFILRCRLVNRTWNATIMYAYLNKFRITSGYFPRGFDPRKPYTARRIPRNARPGFELLPAHAFDNLRNLHRSNYFLHFPKVFNDYIRTLVIEASCTSGDVDPKNAVEIHTQFATGVLKLRGLQSITIHCHGQSRIDEPYNGLDTFFGLWDLAIATYVERQATSSEPWPPGPVERTPKESLYERPVFPHLRELRIIGKSGRTYISDQGLENLLHFIGRHKCSMRNIYLEDVGIKSEAPDDKLDVLEDIEDAVDRWSAIKKQILEKCTRRDVMRSLDLKSVVYSAIRTGPAPELEYKKHVIVHHYDWPYENDIIVSSKHGDDGFSVDRYSVACGCETPKFGPSSLNESLNSRQESESDQPPAYSNPPSYSNSPSASHETL